MKIVTDTFEALYEIKKSTFLSYLTPMSDFNSLHAKLKEDNPKAVHIVWAYRYLNEFNQIVENSSDDGEPKGTSGPPILNVMRGLELVNSGILVVRYFGGIKLGTGGLVRAYGTSAKLVLELATLKEFEIKKEFIFTCGYSFVNKIEHFLNKEEIDFKDREFLSDEVLWKINVTKSQENETLIFLEELIQTQNVKIIKNCIN